MSKPANKLFNIWLFAVCLFIVILVIFGGWVRLTRSGLSIVEWRVFTGIIPPIGDEAWEDTFAKYQLTPEFQKINHSITLDEYKFIYYNEYIHRLLGRWTGLLYVLPLFYYLWKGVIPWRQSGPYLAIGLGFAFQGFLGWYMVSSGLIDRPSVSHYRLTAHLLTALLLLGLCFWVGLHHLYGRERPSDHSSRKSAQTLGILVVAVLILQISYGGLVAGLKAGTASSTWPLLFGKLIPPGLLSFMEPWWRNLVEAPVTVHYIHRWFAFAVLIAALVMWARTRRKEYFPAISQGIFLMIALVCVQIALGVSVIWFHVPLWLALLHQATALTLFVVSLFLNHRILYGTTAPVVRNP